MRYRKLTSDGDYSFGQGQKDFLINSPATVGQAVKTALNLLYGEWFLNKTAGVDWLNKVMGFSTNTRDIIIKAAILNTPGVTGIVDYSSYIDTSIRQYSVTVTIDTAYGQTTVSTGA